ncbi:hypothetical protein F01_420879 [Burkholderia cenocepacia]|nr:hypothetical protein F01_420879 [Burkholderia cenocepacia]
MDSARLPDRGRAHAHQRERLSRQSVRTTELHDGRRAVTVRGAQATAHAPPACGPHAALATLRAYSSYRTPAKVNN